MQVYIITGESIPFGMAATNRISCYAKGLISSGVKCEIVIYTRNRNINNQKYINKHGTGTFEGISFRYPGGKSHQANNKLLRFLHRHWDKYKTTQYLKKNLKHGDIILAYMREDKYAKKLIHIAKKNDIAIYRDLCELPYATRKENGNTRSRSIDYLKNIFPQFTGAICISDTLLNVAYKYNPFGNHIKIPILVDLSKWDYEQVDKKTTDFPYIFHSGTLYQQKDGILDVLRAYGEALPQIPSNVKYLFTGSIDNTMDAEQIKVVIKKYQLENRIKFLGYLEQKQLLSYIKGAMFFIIFKNDNLQNKYCFATKTGEYLLSGNALITTNIGEANNYLKDDENACVIETGNTKLLTEAIVKFVNSPQLRKRIGAKGRETALKNFSCQVHGERLRTFFSKNPRYKNHC